MDKVLSSTNALSIEFILPGIVLRELMNKCDKPIHEAHKQLEEATRKFSMEMPEIDLEEEKSSIKNFLNKNFTITEIPPELDKYVERAVSKKKPFGKNDQGFRDVIIWEETMDLAKSSDETVYLVTENRNDFNEEVISEAQNLNLDIVIVESFDELLMKVLPGSEEDNKKFKKMIDQQHNQLKQRLAQHLMTRTMLSIAESDCSVIEIRFIGSSSDGQAEIESDVKLDDGSSYIVNAYLQIDDDHNLKILSTDLDIDFRRIQEIIIKSINVAPIDLGIDFRRIQEIGKSVNVAPIDLGIDFRRIQEIGKSVNVVPTDLGIDFKELNETLAPGTTNVDEEDEE